MDRITKENAIFHIHRNNNPNDIMIVLSYSLGDIDKACNEEKITLKKADKEYALWLLDKTFDANYGITNETIRGIVNQVKNDGVPAGFFDQFSKDHMVNEAAHANAIEVNGQFILNYDYNENSSPLRIIAKSEKAMFSYSIEDIDAASYNKKLSLWECGGDKLRFHVVTAL